MRTTDLHECRECDGEDCVRCGGDGYIDCDGRCEDCVSDLIDYAHDSLPYVVEVAP